MTELILREADHTYWLGKQRIPSVSEIIKPVCNFDGIPVDVLERKSDIGKALHKLAEWHDRDGLKSIDRKSIDPAVLPYFEAWRKFHRDMKPKWETIEHKQHSPAYGYAGTEDRFGTLLGETWEIDIKTVATVSPATGLQTAAYCGLRFGMIGPVRRGAVQLKPDGTYRLVEFTDRNDWPVFLSLLNLWKWKVRNGIEH